MNFAWVDTLFACLRTNKTIKKLVVNAKRSEYIARIFEFKSIAACLLENTTLTSLKLHVTSFCGTFTLITSHNTTKRKPTGH